MIPVPCAAAWGALALVLFPGSGAAQLRAPLELSEPPREVLFDAGDPSALWAVGADYKAGFDRRGARFAPFLGSGAPRTVPIALALTEATLDGEPLEVAAEAEPRLEGSTVLYERGALTELYRAEPRSLEHLFRLDALPRRGELSLRIEVESELAARAEGGGVLFEGERGGARYGAAVAFDAAGRRVDAPVRLEGSTIEILVPADFVARAAVPLTVDPLITTLSLDVTPARDLRPDVAYDASLDLYAVCWERVFSQTDHDVHGQILDGAGNLVREFAIDVSPGTLRHPRIAGIDALDRFLVAAIEDQSLGPVVGRLLDLAGGLFVVGPPTTLLPFDLENFDLGGDPGAVAPHAFCLVAEGSYLAIPYVDLRIVHADGTPGPLYTYADACEPCGWNPRVSRALGGPADQPSGWGVLVETGYGHTQEIRLLRMHPAGSPSLDTLLTFTNADDFVEGVAQVLDAATGAPKQVGVWERVVAPGQSRLVALVKSGTTGGSLIPLAGDPTTSVEEASIDGDGSSFVVAYTARPTGGGPTELRVASYVLEGLGLVKTEELTIPVLTQPPSAPRVFSTRSGGGAPGRFFVAWQEGPAQAEDVRGALYDTPGPGVRYCTAAPNSVGPGATIHASGSIAIELDAFSLSATGCPPNRPGIFYLGLNPIELPFGEGFRCIGGATRRIAPVVTTDSAGEVALQLDFDLSYGDLVQPGSPGVNYQFWYRDPAGGPSNFNLTDALSVEHTP